MAVGKNKGLAKVGKKGGKKKVIDPFSRKDWYDVSTDIFNTRQVGKTFLNCTQGTKIAREGLKGHVFEVSLSDLQKDNDAMRSFRKFHLIAEDVQERNVLTNFHCMEMTTVKFRSMVKKWQTLKDIEKMCQVYSLHDVRIRKLMILKKPRFDLSLLLEMHGDVGGKGTEDVVSEGVVVDRPEDYESPVQQSF